MFRNVLFIIEETALCRSVSGAMQELAEEGGSVRIGLAEDYQTELEQWQMTAEESVIVTDSAKTAHQCTQSGQAVVVLLTEQNRGESFEGIRFALVLSEEKDGTAVLENPGLDYFRKVYERIWGLPWTILRTERLLVREICPEDLDRLYEIYAEPEITRYMEGLYEDREKEEAYTRAYIRNMYGFYGYGMWIVEERESGRIIGRAGIEHREGTEEPEIGYLIAKEYQHRGYASEVCRAILQYAKEELGFTRMNCYIHPDNSASAALCKKLGFKRCKTEGAETWDSREGGGEPLIRFVRELA